MNTLLEYKGYHGSVEYDADDNILVGEVLGIDDSLNFHGSSIDELTETFHNCIDNYLDFCAEIGKNPEKEYSGRFSVRINPEMHKKIYIMAESKGMSISNAIEDAIAQYS